MTVLSQNQGVSTIMCKAFNWKLLIRLLNEQLHSLHILTKKVPFLDSGSLLVKVIIDGVEKANQ
jgi:hypothetical protein